MMWDFAFSYIGMVVLIGMLAFSLISVWVYGANVRSSASKNLLSLSNNAVRIAQQDSSVRQQKLVFALRKKNILYWKSDFNLKQRKISQPIGAFLSDSVYHCTNVAFTAFLFARLGRHRIKYDLFDLVARIVLAVCVVNLVWSALLGAWIVVAVLFAIMLVLLVVDLSLFQKDVNQARQAAAAFLTERAGEELHKPIKSYAKYLPLFLLKKYVMSFSQPFVEVGQFLWDFGRDKK